MVYGFSEAVVSSDAKSSAENNAHSYVCSVLTHSTPALIFWILRINS
jgi:hypothetical protein